MKVTKSTIIRTLVLFVVLVNMGLKSAGKPVLDIPENSVEAFVEFVIQAAAIAASWWYNNSFSEEAKKADEYLQQLKDEKVTEE